MRVFNINFKFPTIKRKHLILLVTVLILLYIPLGIVSAYNFVNQDKIAPGVEVAGVDLGGLNNNDAYQKLKQNITVPTKIDLSIDNQNFQIPSAEIQLSYDYQASVNEAYTSKRPNLLTTLLYKIKGNRSSLNLPLSYQVNKDSLSQYTSVIAGQISIEPIYPTVSLVDGKVVVEKGSAGKDITSDALNRLIDEKLKFANSRKIIAKTKHLDPTLAESEIGTARARGKELATKSATIKSDDQEMVISSNDLLNLVNPKGGFYSSELNSLINTADNTFNRDPVNAVFNFKNGKVVEFSPAKTGVKIKNDELKADIVASLNGLEKNNDVDVTFKLPADITQPKITTQEVNHLGIKELIGKGESNFHHSISSRIYNVALAASKFNGVLIPPGNTFSFNDTLGDVSSYTGYKQAYVIKDGKTVLGDGGGVCQVSTTMFRAALNAGLPIVERHAHSYRVSYYEEGYPVGIDATVYSPTTDFKFKNDTPGYILVQTKTDTKKMHLTFEFYGTSDGRVASLTKPVITSVTPPPDDLYIDDPTLPAGEIKQIDWKAWGAKVNFNYKVRRDGETIENKTFYSNYQPWQAKFLKGTGPTS